MKLIRLERIWGKSCLRGRSFYAVFCVEAISLQNIYNGSPTFPSRSLNLNGQGLCYVQKAGYDLSSRRRGLTSPSNVQRLPQPGRQMSRFQTSRYNMKKAYVTRWPEGEAEELATRSIMHGLEN
jgi:hypothetical protein